MSQPKVLIIGPAWIGDMVMAQSLFKVLSAQGKVIDVVATPWCEVLLKRMPQVRQTITLAIGHGEVKLKQRYQLAKQLHREYYQQAIVLPNSFKSALIPYFARIPKRTGWRREFRSSILNDTRRLDKRALPLMVQRFVALAFDKHHDWDKQFPPPQLQVDSQAVNQTLARYQLTNLDPPILALSPGAAFGPAKRWPAEHFAEVARVMLAKGWQVWLFGSKNEQVITAQIQALTHQACVDLAGRLQLDEALDLVSQATIVVSNDSGLLHIAAALNRPLVALYGSTSSEFTPPLSKQVKLLKLNLPCQPCFKRTCPLGHLNCLKALKPSQALGAIAELYQVNQSCGY